MLPDFQKRRLLMSRWLTIGLSFFFLLSIAGCGGGKTSVPDTPDGAVKAMSMGLADHQPDIIWAALPASYQNDVNGLVRDFGAKVDADLYNKGFSIIKKLVTVLKTKKDFILGHPMLQQMAQDSGEVSKHWDSVVGLFDTIVNSKLADHSALKTLDVGKFLGTTGRKVMEQMSEISRLSKEDPFNKEMKNFSGIQVQVLSQEGDKAKLKVTIPGKKDVPELELIRIEGKWVPKDLADEWKQTIEKARSSLKEMDTEEFAKNKVQIMGMMGGFEAVMDQLAKAKSQAEFNNGLQGILGMLMGGMAPPSGTPSGGGAIPR